MQMQRRYRNFKKLRMAEVALRMAHLLEERHDFARFDVINQAIGKVRILKAIRNIHKTVRVHDIGAHPRCSPSLHHAAAWPIATRSATTDLEAVS